MAFTLTLLGTDTSFKPNDYIAETPSSETLSFISSRIDSTNDHAQIRDIGTDDDDDDAYVIDANPEASAIKGMAPAYALDDVVVINGPDTAGSIVYDKISEGLCALLDAIARGESVLNIIGHSRGAVESILVAHELERIQTSLRENPGIDSVEAIIEVICNSIEPKTKAKLMQLLEPLKNSGDTAQLVRIRDAFCDEETPLEVNIFALDPVPGEFVAFSNTVKLFNWSDNRYFTIPSIVKDYRQIVLENERSRGFRGIIPKVEDPDETQFSLLNMPGHHGTASGNPLSQQLVKLEGDASHVQLATIYQLHDFLSAHDVAFLSPDDDEYFLDPVYRNYNDASIAQRASIRKDNYDLILKNKAAYKAFDNTSYATTQEHGVSRSILGGYVNDRIVYYHNATETHLSSVLSFKTDGFVNAEHALLALNLELHGQEKTAAEQLIGFTQCFQSEHPDEETLVDVLDPSKHKKPELLQHTHQCLEALVEQVIQTYLRNNLAEDQKVLIESAVINIVRFYELDKAFLTDVKTKLMNKLRDVIKSQVDSQYDDLTALVLKLDVDPEDKDIAPDADDFLYAGTNMVYRAFEKYQQFKLFKNHLDDLLGLGFEKGDYPIFYKQSQRLKLYAEAVQFYCAKAMVNNEVALPEELLDDPFGREVQALVNGMLRDQHPDIFNLQDNIDDVRNGLQQQIENSPFDGLTLQILGGFAAVLGIGAVALALTVLTMGVAALIPVVVIGVGLGLAALGMFSFRQGVKMEAQQAIYNDLEEAALLIP